MNFIQNAFGWSAHETPFSFDLLARHDGQVNIIWNYAGSSGEHVANHERAAIDWCHQFMLSKTLNQLQRIAPPGARTAETDEGWQFLCNGSDPDMGYLCYLRPGHIGQCYYPIKGAWFDKEYP